MLRLFGDKLLHLRKQHGVTQKTLAEQLGILRQSHLSLLESGRREPSVGLALSVATHFRVSLDYLLRDSVPIEQVLAFTADTTVTPSASTQSFGRKLRYLRELQQKHQSEIAAALFLRTQSHISLLENKRSEPSIDLAIAVANLFGVSLDYLLRDDVPLEAAQ